ncbi:MAG: site-2 protease family protein [Verrucomicrobia bacterium]|nr:site-2 protease family protein [Verrucomicrobiota bacterium]
MDFLAPLLSNVWSAFLVVLFFGGSIFVHELGHFLAARKRGAKVERFSIGFGPAIWSRRGKDGVEYRLSWIPLGGYVLLPQLADLGPVEGSSTTDVTTLSPIDYTSKLLILVAGASFNILFAFALACVVWLVGEPTFSELNTTRIGTVNAVIKLADGTTVPNPAAEAGLQAGDNVTSIDGHRVANFEDILNGVLLGKGRASDDRRKAIFVIERAGQSMEIVVYPRLLGDDKIRISGVEPAEDLTAESLLPDWPAALAGIKPGDRVLAVDGKPVFQRVAISEYLTKNASRPSEFLLQRGPEQITLRIQPRLDTDERTGKSVPRGPKSPTTSSPPSGHSAPSSAPAPISDRRNSAAPSGLPAPSTNRPNGISVARSGSSSSSTSTSLFSICSPSPSSTAAKSSLPPSAAFAAANSPPPSSWERRAHSSSF